MGLLKLLTFFFLLDTVLVSLVSLLLASIMLSCLRMCSLCYASYLSCASVVVSSFWSTFSSNYRVCMPLIDFTSFFTVNPIESSLASLL